MPILPPHLNDAQIIACLDGELSPAELQASKTHLENCWICRSRAGAIQSSIESFVRTRQSVLPEPTIFDETRVEQFRQRLGRHARESGTALSVSDRMLQRLGTARRWLREAGAMVQAHRQAAIAVAMTACLLVVMFTDVLNTRVSADTLLTRAQHYETSHSAATGQVTRTSLRVERIEKGAGSRSLGSITVVHDSQGPTYISQQLGSNVKEEVLTAASGEVTTNLLRTLFANSDDDPLLQYLTAQRWVPDVSVASFRELVRSRDRSDTSVSKAGSTVELHYPFASGHLSGISEAMLTVDAENYSPSELSIVTGGSKDSREYRFTRTAFTVESRQVELARLVGPPNVAGAPGHEAPSTPNHKASPLTYLNSVASSEEVAVASALHRADACLGEEIYLFPMSDGSMLVQGLVDGPARRNALRESLKTVTGPLRVELFLPRELKSGGELYPPPDELSDRLRSGGNPSYTATLADLSSVKMPLYDQLYKHFVQTGSSSDGIDKQIAVFSNEVVTLARQTFLHAWALKKLDREFSSERIAKLTPADLAKVEQIRQDHRRWISNLAHQQAEMLSHVGNGDSTAALTNDSNLRDSETLLRLAQEQNDLVRSLFTSSNASPETSGSLSRLLSVLHRMGS
jgi:anti-sigma factor RsiW